jgi:hypothetical protein
MYCPTHEAELNAALAAEEKRREIEANACYERWMNGDSMDDNAAQSSAQTEPIRQPDRKHTGNRREW